MAKADTTSCAAPLAHNDIGKLRVVVGKDKITLKTTHMPTAIALRDLWHVMQEAGFTEATFSPTNDGYAFLQIHRKHPDGGVVRSEPEDRMNAAMERALHSDKTLNEVLAEQGFTKGKTV
jgi:hypothetical protein